MEQQTKPEAKIYKIALRRYLVVDDGGRNNVRVGGVLRCNAMQEEEDTKQRREEKQRASKQAVSVCLCGIRRPHGKMNFGAVADWEGPAQHCQDMFPILVC